MERFTLERTSRIEFLDALLYEYKHLKTGMPVLILKNSDPNRAFMIQFRTLPTSDNGLPHILEHAVLSGSRKYDVKEPFVELLKGSLNTFLNAMTMPDRTLYPFSTTNQAEFYQLCDVYLDGVFFPNIHHDARILGQEGWHYRWNDEDELSISGVVFNEMKGALSQPEQMLFSELQTGLFDNAYGFVAGGRPEAIPGLTQAEFVDYHKRHYHPSNGAIFTYGDLDPQEVLTKMAQYLDQFDRAEWQGEMEKTPAFFAPKQRELPYSVMKKEPNQAIFGMAFAQGDYHNRLDNLGLRLLSLILFSMESSPIKSMLQAAGLVHDVFAQFEDGFLQPMTLIGCHGLERDDADFIAEAIMFELERLSDDGIDPEVVQAGINQWKFMLREGFQEGTSSKGISFGMDVLAQLDRGVAAAERLDYNGLTKQLEDKVADGYLEELIKKYFVDNTHRVDLLLWPDEKLAAREEAAWTKRIADIKHSLSEADIKASRAFQDSLTERQLTPDDPLKLEAMPRLDVADLSEDIEAIDLSKVDAPFEMYQTITRSKGISYLTLMIGLDDPGEENLSSVGILSALLTNLGTNNRSYQKLNSDIMKLTGGVQVSPQVFTKDGQSTLWLQLNLNVLDEYLSEAIELIFDVLESTSFDDLSRIENVLHQVQTGFESFLLSRGDIVSADLTAAQFEASAGWAQQINGAPVYQEIKALAKDPKRIKEWIPRLKSLFESIRAKDRLHLIYQGEQAEAVAKDIAQRSSHWPERGDQKALPKWSPVSKKEALIIPSSVAYAAKGFDYKQAGAHYSGQLLTAKQLIDTDYLWEKVRVLGGAYGSGLQLDPAGALVCTSFRDPRPAESLQVFGGIADYLEELELKDEDLAKYIIGTYGALNQPLNSDLIMGYAIRQVMEGFGDEDRRRIQQEVLATKPADLSALSSLFRQLADTSHETVLGSKRLCDELPEDFETTSLF